jgi:hypothetical protein
MSTSSERPSIRFIYLNADQLPALGDSPKMMVVRTGSYGISLLNGILLIASNCVLVRGWECNAPRSLPLRVPLDDESDFALGCIVSSGISRRQAWKLIMLGGLHVKLLNQVQSASSLESSDSFYLPFETRDRKGNRDAIIREDYWYITGTVPPRQLNNSLQADNPGFNAFGSCSSTVGTENPCTYVSLKQRIPTYGKYANSIRAGALQYSQLGQLLRAALEGRMATSEADLNWSTALSYVAQSEQQLPPPIVDAELKMILFATSMLTSPNFPGPSRELLVARFYANEVRFATVQLRDAIQSKDATQAAAAWEFGRDSWNSYFMVVNRAISSKVGDPLGLVPDELRIK